MTVGIVGQPWRILGVFFLDLVFPLSEGSVKLPNCKQTVRFFIVQRRNTSHVVGYLNNKHTPLPKHTQPQQVVFNNAGASTQTRSLLEVSFSPSHIKNKHKKLQLWQQCLFLLQKQTLNSQLPFLMLVAEIKANWSVNWADGAGVYELHLHCGLSSRSTHGSLVTTWLHRLSPKHLPFNTPKICHYVSHKNLE